MGVEEGNGLSLEGLALRLETQAQKLETLERENEKMRSENDALQSKVATLEGSGTRRDREAASEFEGRVSRRALLSKAGAAAVAAVAAGVFLHPRPAKAGVDVFDSIWCADLIADTGGVNSLNRGSGPGVQGEGQTGVWGRSSATGFSGVSGTHTGTSGYGVVGDGKGSDGAGVLGRNPIGHGVRGEGEVSVLGKSSTAGAPAVYGQNSNGDGVRGVGKAGVIGRSSTTGYEGVYGQHTGTSGYGVVGDGKGSGAGVLGRNPSGYGGQFDGGLAQLKLNPKGTTGKPTSGAHTKGEIYMDSAGTLFVCTANGTPGTWRKVTTTAA
jgi:hypothetical protein